MASSEERKTSPAPISVEDELREDLWLYRGQRWGRNARWFALSAVAHVLLLGLLATLTLTIVQKRREQIKIAKVTDISPSLEEQERLAKDEKPPDDWEGEPSLKDLPGVLTMEQLAPKKAQTPEGPPPETGRVQAVRAPIIAAPPPPSSSIPPVLNGLGPGVIQTNTNRDGTGQFSSNGIGAIGNAVGGLGGAGGDYVGGLRKVGLDVVLVIDATDSMQFVTDSLKARLLKLIVSLQKMVPTTRIGIVAYRDKGEEYVTRWVDLSFSTSKLQDFVSNLRAGGGGDWPEAVYDGLEVAISDMKWRKNSKRVIILVPGSPPHPETVSNILQLAQNFQAQGGVLSVLDLADKMHEDFERALHRTSDGLINAEFKPTPLPAFYQEFRNTMSSVAKAGGGDFIPLTEDKALTRQIIIMTFGSRWQVEMAKYMRDLE